MLRMQPVCVFKYVTSDSRYHTHFRKDLEDPSELAKTKVTGIPTVELSL